MCSLIRLLPTTCIALFWSTGLAQVDLDKEPSSGRFIIEGIVVTNEGQRQSLGYTPSDLLFLLCNIDEVPGYTVVVREYRPEVDAGTVAWQMPYGHTYVHLNVGGDEEYPGERVSCEIIRTWVPHQRAQAYLKRSIPSYTELTAQDCIRVVIRLSTVSVPALEEQMRSSPIVFARGSPSGEPLGDECWHVRHPTGEGGAVMFRYDTCRVGIEAPNIELAEALGQSVLYRLMVHPKVLVKRQRAPQVQLGSKSLSGTAAALNDVVVTPISSLRLLGVRVTEQRDAEIWQVTLQYRNRWVRVSAFSREAWTEAGKVALKRAVFPFRGELVVPLKQVAEGLGIRVEQRGETIVLLP